MFLEMFAASALAQVIFSNNSSSTSRDYTGCFNALNTKCDAMHDDIKFIKARMCLEHFSVKLFDNIRLTIERHTVEDIIAAATVGFETLCYIARIDDDDFKEARNKFKETFGNYDWVNAQYHDRIEAVENFITFTEDETAHYRQICETIQKYNKAITELNNTSLLRFLKRNKLHVQIQNISESLTYTSHLDYGRFDRKYALFLFISTGYKGEIGDIECLKYNYRVPSNFLIVCYHLSRDIKS